MVLEEEGTSPNPAESASIFQAFFLHYLQKPDHLPISTSLPVPLMPKLSNINLVFILSMKVRFLNPGLLELIPSSFVGFLFCFVFSFFGLFFSFWSWAPCDFSKMEQRVGKEKQPSPFPAGMSDCRVSMARLPLFSWPLQTPLMSECPGMSLY